MSAPMRHFRLRHNFRAGQVSLNIRLTTLPASEILVLEVHLVDRSSYRRSHGYDTVSESVEENYKILSQDFHHHGMDLRPLRADLRAASDTAWRQGLFARQI